MKQPVCLAMIVRNEAHVLRRCLESVKPYISHYAIVDTGSTDGTQDLAREVLKDLPGEVLDREWTDFSTARNTSLNAARRLMLWEGGLKGSYALVIDADEELVKVDPSAEWPVFELDSYTIRLRMAGSDAVWCRRQVFSLEKDWHYEDEIHERSVATEPLTSGGILGFEILSYNDSARNAAGMVAKAKRDIPVLKRMMKRNPAEPRYVYYLAQTLMNAGDVDGAIRYHERRLAMGGFEEERFSSALHIAALMEKRGDHWEDVVAAYLKAYEVRPTRAEPLWAVAALLNDRGRPALAEVYARQACRLPRPADALVVNEGVYGWMCADELAGSLCRQGRVADALPILRRLNDFPNIPEAHRPRIAANLAEAEQLVAS